MRPAALIACALALSGCGMNHYAKQAVDQYCATPVLARYAARQALHQLVQPHRIELHCETLTSAPAEL